MEHTHPDPVAGQPRVSFDEQIAKNKRETVIVAGVMLVLLFSVIYAIGVLWGTPPVFTGIVAVLIALAYVTFTWAQSTHTVLLASKARPARDDVREEKLLKFRVEEMALAAGMPVPQVFIQDSNDINAFATGLTPDRSIICVTRGALQRLTQEELEGVIGHEMSHIANYDVRLATVTIGVVGAIAMMAEIGVRSLLWGGGRGGRGKGSIAPVLIVLAIVGLILAPILSRLTYLFLSRRREYLADATGAKLTRNPEGLAEALEKIKTDLPDDPVGNRTVSSLYIANPWNHLSRESVWSTHPPIEERIRRLRSM